jgi:hypothetical protein
MNDENYVTLEPMQNCPLKNIRELHIHYAYP